MAERSDVQEAFLTAATVPLDHSHASGDLRAAHQLLSRDSSLESASIDTAATLGNPEHVATWLRINPALPTATGGPHRWDPLTTLCFSRFLRLDPTRRDGFLRSASLLLDAGADPNTGFWSGLFLANDSNWQ